MAEDKDTPTKTDPPQTPTPDPAIANTPGAQAEVAKGTKCPKCKDALDLYDGTNPLKVGTGFCAACGVRYRLKG